MPDAERMREFNDRLIEDFRTHGGQVTSGPGAEGGPLLLLTTVGVRTGLSRTTPLGYARDDGDYIVVAGNMGAQSHPGWYHNLRAEPEVIVEVGAERLPARARVAEGPEHDRLWALMRDRVGPVLEEFQDRSGRRIPVVVLERGAETTA